MTEPDFWTNAWWRIICGDCEKVLLLCRCPDRFGDEAPDGWRLRPDNPTPDTVEHTSE